MEVFRFDPIQVILIQRRFVIYKRDSESLGSWDRSWNSRRSNKSRPQSKTTAAARAGIKAGDLITKIDDKATKGIV